MTALDPWFTVRQTQADASAAAVVRGFPNLRVELPADARQSADNLRAWQLATHPNHTPEEPAMTNTSPPPSQTLRAAAQRIRALAAQATPSGTLPHGWSGAVGHDNAPMLFGGPTEDGYRMGTIFSFQEETYCGDCTRPSAGDVAHMAAWHPDVAEAVADFLDQAAKSADYMRRYPPPFTSIALRIAAMFAPVEEPAAVVVVSA